MAFDQSTRNRLQNFVRDAREHLTQEFIRQLQNDYGMDPVTGEVSDMDRLTHLDDTRRQTARILRETLSHYRSGSPSPGVSEAMERIVREQAFTVLNRLCAVRMAEARGFIFESVGSGYHSKGFQLYSRVSGTALGETGEAYRCYLFSLFDEFAIDLPVLFDRFSPMGRLFPKESALLHLLDKINAPEIASLWTEDETIGWIYQYFNTVEERRKMRAESQAPRNSRELAVRNQFFTPRYVVEFLTDNTLGRIWYEMTKGATSLKDSCRYLVRRPTEIFLAEGEEAPAAPTEAEGGKPESEMTQEELLRQPVYIPHRPLKDPREIRMLDPACGSMHFGLYSFDLYERIYEEAWEIEESGKWPEVRDQVSEVSGQEKASFSGPLHSAYSSKEALRRDVPRLIIEHNIHGVDIDPRAVQIAGLSLWLRAQRSWQEQGVKPGNRPRILKSNIVCAEPMPGEKDLLKEFSQKLKPRVLGQLLEIIFDKMKLAGEAGSLLKIEEELEEAVENAREEFSKELLRRAAGGEQAKLFSQMERPKQQALFDFADLPDKTRFWQTAQERILDALKEYAVHAEAGDGYRRRLFAEDAARGFAFIEICRKRFELVLMNPPFGEPCRDTRKWLGEVYPRANQDIFCQFIERAVCQIHSQGLIGTITSRTCFFLSSFRDWRIHLLINKVPLKVTADLGHGVLDAALVETAAYVLAKDCQPACVRDSAFFARLLKEVDKASVLQESIRHLQQGKFHRRAYIVSVVDLKSIPGSPIAYWVTPRIRKLFHTYRPFAGDGRHACVTNPAGDDMRYIRASWEIPGIMFGKPLRWVPLAKGGEYSPYFSDIHLLIDWDDTRQTYRGFIGTEHRPLERPASVEHFFRPGVTWPRSTIKGFSVRALPAGSIFADKGPCAFVFDNGHEDLRTMLAIMNTRCFEFFVFIQHGSRAWEVGFIKRVPFPKLTQAVRQRLGALAQSCIQRRQWCDSGNETSHVFLVPHLIGYTECSIANAVSQLDRKTNALEENDQRERATINDFVYKAYSLSEEDRHVIESHFLSDVEPGLDDSKLGIVQVIPESSVVSILSYCIGLCIGRWDLSYVTGQKQPLKLPDPFAPLPICPPGMLQNADGLPATPEDVPADYPMRISWSGILVDDEGHGEDTVGRVREAMEVIWKERAGDIEQEACEILGVRSLLDYFSKPAKFFADHLKRYSKSRRQAPIYWPLSTASGSYTLWIYYHRLTDQILYTCVNDFVEPKLAAVAGELAELQRRRAAAGGKLPGAEEKEYTRLTDLDLELRDFRDELLRIARFWKPNLNDGVQITASPLWKLFLHKPWQKTLKETWKKLEKGDYDWAHLAFSIWPERVIRASHKDRSYAIAHDLEEDLWEEVEVGKDKKGKVKTKWIPQDLSEDDLRRIINEKTTR